MLAALILLAATSTSHAGLIAPEQVTSPAPTVTNALPQSAFRAARLLYDLRPKDGASGREFEIPRLHAVRVAQTDKVAEHVDVTFDLEFPAKHKDTWPALFDTFRKGLHDSGAWLGDELVLPAPKLVEGVVRFPDLKLALDASKLPAIEVAGLTPRAGTNVASYIRKSGCTDRVEIGELKLSARGSTSGFERVLVEPMDAKLMFGFVSSYNFGMVLEGAATDACVTEWTLERITAETRGNPFVWKFALVVDHRVEDTRPR